MRQSDSIKISAAVAFDKFYNDMFIFWGEMFYCSCMEGLPQLETKILDIWIDR